MSRKRYPACNWPEGEERRKPRTRMPIKLWAREKKQEHFLKTFAAMGGTLEEAALASSIPFTTVKGWMAEDEGFRARRDAVLVERRDRMVPGALQAYEDALANKEDVKHRLHVADKVLQTVGLVKGERQEVTGPDGGVIPIRIVAVAIGEAGLGKPFREIKELTDGSSES